MSLTPEFCGHQLQLTGIAYPSSRLTGRVYFAGVMEQFLVQFIEVKVENGLQSAADPEFTDVFLCIHTAAGADGHLQTVNIMGRPYVLVITPYSE